METSFSWCTTGFTDPFLFLVYINDLPNELKSTVKLYADDTSLFSIVRNKNESANIFNKDLLSISKWAHILKISKGISAIKNFASEIFSNNSQSFFKAPN